jgi:ubiquinone/menaquinone biosynthesis C-methylase UbiE
MAENLDRKVVEGFGDEWSRFDQSALTASELQEMFDNYFNIFPWEKLPPDAVGFDLGCGSGRWAKIAAPRVGKLHLIDPSIDALAVARRNMQGVGNCEFHNAGVENIPLADASCDFGYSLGVLHHIPDTEKGLEACVAKLKQGAPFLLYLYYRFDNRPFWFRAIWKISDILRRFVSRLPRGPRYAISQVLAALVYFPLARASKLLEARGVNVEKIPLSQYRNSSFYVMRNDALDRFGTRLERRFTRKEMREMMERAGLENIIFSRTSFWTAVGYAGETLEPGNPVGEN